MSAEAALTAALRTAGGLALAAALAVGVLAVTERAARPRIEANARLSLLAELAVVIPPAAHDSDLLADAVELLAPELTGRDVPVTVYRASQDGVASAAAFEVVAADGYSGDIHLLLGVDPAGRVLGLRVIRHRETPGLGDYIERRRSDWILGFDGRSLAAPDVARWAVRQDGGDFDARTGATVTPRAVVKAVRRALQALEAHHAVLFPPTPAGDAGSTS